MIILKRLTAFFLLMLVVLSAGADDAAKGISFFKGTFQQAMDEAKKQKKTLFVDFYAVWCGPCKRMAKEVFTQDSVGDYFNKKFVSIQVDAEKPENVAIATRYKVNAFPTLAFIDNDGKAISVNVGAMGAAELLDAARTASGESIGFKQLYEKYQQSPQDLKLQQTVLLQAPQFLMAQDGMEAEKWVVRIRKMFRSYIDAKMGPDLINRNDYIILRSLAGDNKEEQEKIVDFINKNLPAWRSAVGQAAAYYVIEYNDQKIENLAKEGNPAYKEFVAKINTDYKDAYSVLAQNGNAAPYESSSVYADAIYTIYKEKDVKKYISLMNKYFNMLKTNATPMNYGKAAQDLYYAAGKKLTPEEHRLAITWVEKALSGENSVLDRINYLVMIGDSYCDLKEYDSAQKYYNQGYAESLQLDKEQMAQQMVQATIARKLATLDLLRK